MIYADNAATTKLNIEAFEAMKPFFFEAYGNASQPYAFARPVKKALKQARETIASCIGALPEEIYFTSCGTESDNWAIKGLLKFGDYRPILTSQIEHHAILHTCSTLERMGYPVVYIPVDSTGTVSPKTLTDLITDNTKLVSIMLANNEIGTIQPIKELCEIAHQHGALFHSDAVQAVGHIEIDVNQLGVDMLSASAHKFNGPKGIGFLYIRKGTKLSPYVDGGAQENGMRAGTENVAAIVGMATALKSNCDDMKENVSHLKHLEIALLGELDKTGIDYKRNGINHLPGNISLSFKGMDGEIILHRVDLMGICVSTGSACDSMNTQISHVLTAIQSPEEYAKGTIRISLGKNNTLSDVTSIVGAIVKIISNEGKKNF